MYREKPGVKVTYDAFHYMNLITGHMLQLTNPDASRSYVTIYLHENVSSVGSNGRKGPAAAAHLPAVVAILGPEGNPVRYKSLYYNRFPERQLWGRGPGRRWWRRCRSRSGRTASRRSAVPPQ